MKSHNTMTIHIHELEFQAIIGLLPYERSNTQRVIIECSLEYHYNDKFIDYIQVKDYIISTMQEKCFKLLEEALIFISNGLKNIFYSIIILSLKITKPDILDNGKISVSYYKNFQDE